MKRIIILFFVIIIAAWGLTGCKNHGADKDSGNDNPVFQTDPGLKKITEQIVASPADATLYFSRGELLHRLQLDSLAVKDYIKASVLDSTKAEYFSAVGDLLFEHKDLTGSVKWLQKAVALNPQDRKAHLKISKLFLYIHNFPKAVIEANIALRKDAYDPEGYFLKALAYLSAKDTAKATSLFFTAINVAPDYRDAYVQLGLIYSNKKDSIALKYLDNAYNLDSSDVFPLYARGVFFQRQNDHERAKQEYRRCILKNSHFVDAYFSTGYILMHEDSVQKAFRQYDIATKIDYANPTAFYNRGFCYEKMDSMRQAVEDYRHALALDTAYSSPKEALKRLKVKP